MTKDELMSAISWAEAEAEKCKENAALFAEPPQDLEGRCLAHAKHLRETARRYELLAQAAKNQLSQL